MLASPAPPPPPPPPPETTAAQAIALAATADQLAEQPEQSEQPAATSPPPLPSPPLPPPPSSGPPAVQGSVQPLPRGRPPRPKPPPNPPGNFWGHQTLRPQDGTRKPPLGSAYTRGGHLLGGYNPARYMGVSNAYPQFDPNGKFFYLTGPSNIRPWISEITYMARALSCFDELTNRFTGFPPPNTIQLFICETRFATAWRVLEGTIAGQVWAYMRVLGYSSIPANPDNPLMSPSPVDCFEFAQRAASRMLVPGTPEQPQDERKRMVDEIVTAQAADYPSERSYKKGIKWLRLACDNLIKQGDHDLAVLLYDPIPEWAPKRAVSQSPALETDANRTGSATSPEGSQEYPVSSVPALASPVEPIIEVSPAAAHATPSPAVQEPAPVQTTAKKRKRSQKDEGPRSTQAAKTQVESAPGL